MSELTEVLAGILAIGFVLVVYLVYFGILFSILLVFVWAVWNWIVLPTMPYIAGLFA